MSRPAATRATSCAGQRSRRRSALRAVLLSFVLLLLGLALPGAALAHAQLVSLDPANGARLATSPPAVTLTFNERIGLATGGLKVIDATGAVMDQGEDVVSGVVVSQPLPPLPDGWYVATWGIISEDGHIVRASSVFAVGDADAALRPAADGGDQSLITGLARFAGDLGILVAAGAWAAFWLLRARLPAVRRLSLGATTLALAGTVAWGLIESQDGGSGWMATSAASLAIVRGVLLAIALVTARTSASVPAAAVALALVTLAGGGHAAGDAWSMVLLSAHLAAAVVWLGAAPAVLLTLRSAALTDDEARGVVRRFSLFAGFALGAIGVAGAALTWNLSDGLAGGLTTPWVLVLGAKVTLVGAAALLGAFGRRSLGATPSRSRLHRLFLVDAVLLVGVAALSAGLTLTSPHVGHPGHQGHGAAGSSRCAAVVGESSVSVILTPGRVGTNAILIGGIPEGMRSVGLRWSHELTEAGALPMEATEGTTGWTATGALPLTGSWEVIVSVRVDTFSAVSGSCRVRVDPWR